MLILFNLLLPFLFINERVRIIRHIRSISKTFNATPVLIAGCSANSVRETLELIKEAQEAGADYDLVFPPNYWAGAMNKPVLK